MEMEIITQLRSDIKQAMKNKDKQKLNALKALLADIQEFVL